MNDMKYSSPVEPFPIQDLIGNHYTRDPISKILLQFNAILENTVLYNDLVVLLENHLSHNKDVLTIDAWSIFILGVLRQNLHMAPDWLTNMANNHNAIRMMLGINSGNNKIVFNQDLIEEATSLISKTLIHNVNELLISHGSTKLHLCRKNK